MILLLPRKTLYQTAFLVISAFFIATGCKNEDMIRPGDPINVAYKKALSTYQKEKYGDAAESFNTVIKASRGTDYARSAHYFLAQSYYKSGQYLLAADAYDRFISLYPKNQKVQRATYQEALSYYNLSPRYALDQTYTLKSIDQFRLYLSRYPNSNKNDKAGQYIAEMRAKLAHKKFEAGELYHRLDEYKSSIVYYQLVVDQYPGSSWAEKALLRQIQTYNEYARKSIPSSKRKRYNKAIDAYEKFIQLFPDGENRSKAEDAVDEARSSLAAMGPAPEKKEKISAE